MAWYAVATWGLSRDGQWEYLNDLFKSDVPESVARNEAEIRRDKVKSGAWTYDPFFHQHMHKKARHTRVLVTTQIWDGRAWITVPHLTFNINSPLP